MKVDLWGSIVVRLRLTGLGFGYLCLPGGTLSGRSSSHMPVGDGGLFACRTSKEPIFLNFFLPTNYAVRDEVPICPSSPYAGFVVLSFV